MIRMTRGSQVITAFGRVQYYRGGKKLETDARRSRVNETEVGIEWLPFPSFELTGALASGVRESADGAAARATQRGTLLKLQAQFNF